MQHAVEAQRAASLADAIRFARDLRAESEQLVHLLENWNEEIEHDIADQAAKCSMFSINVVGNVTAMRSMTIALAHQEAEA